MTPDASREPADSSGEDAPADRERPRRPRSRRRSALAWGAVGALGFLVLHQGYVLLDGEGVTLPAALGVAAVVFVVAAPLSYFAEGTLAHRDESG